MPMLVTRAEADVSHPARGAWIEMQNKFDTDDVRMSHPARGAWIEIRIGWNHAGNAWSHPARGAWIEINRPRLRKKPSNVAPRKGGVD